MRVPIFKEERFHSVPLAGGSCVPYDPQNAPPVNIVKRINGQRLTGEMIPKREDPAGKFNAKNNNKLSSPSSPSSKVPVVISATSATKDETIPLLEEDDEDEEDGHKTANMKYGAVENIPTTERDTRLMQELAFDLIV